MDFTFDVHEIPLIGKPVSGKGDGEKYEEYVRRTQQVDSGHSGNSPRRSSSLSPADNAAIGWKRPWMSQVKKITLGTKSVRRNECPQPRRKRFVFLSEPSSRMLGQFVDHLWSACGLTKKSFGKCCDILS